MDIAEVTKNAKLLLDGVPHAVEEVNFVKPGKGQGIYRLKVRNLTTGRVADLTYRSGDKVEEASVTSHDIQFLYEDGGHYVFMDSQSYEQYPVSKEQLGDKVHFLKEGLVVTILMMEDRPIDVTLPKMVELKVVKVAPSTKTQTITAQPKMAVLETGYSVPVPTFIKEGDTVKIDTRSGEYIERVGMK